MSAELLVVHAVDTEGPLGGDARRLPDGSPEFFDTWDDILGSLAELTDPGWRADHPDSYGGPWTFNWFVMDFTGFRTNPKRRFAEYHDTWDRIHTLPVEADGLYWHYHVPPASGAGDQWSETWLSSNECNVVLARRLLERGSFPAAFRAGGTIEDAAASRWLEHAIPIDFSNRVSERSHPDGDLFHFNWYGAPELWGSYHPSPADVMRPGTMRRFVYRSLDLRSRYNELTLGHVEAAMTEVRETGGSRVLSFFSHDNRDMRPETNHASELLRRASEQTGVPWRSCTAVEAHRRYHGLASRPIELRASVDAGGVLFEADGEPFQPVPFVAAELADGRFTRLYPSPSGRRRWRLRCDLARLRRLGAAVTSVDGTTTIVGDILG
jgi:hypothetical protein